MAQDTTTPAEKPAQKKQHYHRRNKKPQQQNQDSKDNKDTASAPRQRRHYHAKKKDPKPPATTHTPTPESNDNDKGNDSDTSSEASGELCFICTEPIVTYAVGACDHRTCHLCALRLRALYETRNCAYCKTEQPTVIFTKDEEKPYDSYSLNDTPFVDKKLGLRFEEKQVYQDTMLLLQYNCPDPECDIACDGGWPELRKHVKKTHDRFLCELCTKHKKIFAHEHTLYSWHQLQKHIRVGDKALNKDDDTGFKGHPECHFCKINFYGNDELFEHCRDKHEQCHICVREGVRHQYYENYDSLEEHFKKGHYLCLYRECLDRKFVVFETDIDLKAHEVEEHGASIARLSRARQTEARRVDVNFDYGSSSNASGSRGGGDRDRNRRNKARNNEERRQPELTRGGGPTLSDSDFPNINGTPSAPQQQVSKSGGTRSSSKGIRRPVGFGSLSENWPSLGEDPRTQPSGSKAESSQQQAVSSSSSSSAEPEVVSRHAAFLERIFDMLKSHEKVAQFRRFTTAYRNSETDVDTYVDHIVDLFNANTEHISKVIKGVEDLMDNQEKKWEIVRAWRNKQTAMNNFPALETSSKGPAGHGTSSRVLVIKSRNTKSGGTRSTAKSKAGVWDRVASAASGASSLSPRSSPHSSRPSSPAPVTFSSASKGGSRTAWAGGSGSRSTSKENDFPSLGSSNPHFPSLPAAPKQRHAITGLRKNSSYTQLNVWAGERPAVHNEPLEQEESQKGKQRKGKKNKQVLMRVGL
ncbi:hypothetical protein K492DRAFT_174733 [Lichtheimia hyalospora FSU 10163]|nr:hypothetical protein K492DRAFT_174733 [Lichtheimia hyalospora FSU 10163]